MGVTDFVLERTRLKEHLNLSKSRFVGEGHSDCKSQNIAIRTLKGNVLCQIWFKVIPEFCIGLPTARDFFSFKKRNLLCFVRGYKMLSVPFVFSISFPAPRLLLS